MAKRMLIDGTHREETRVAVIDDFKLAEFDAESENKLPLKGNIYLAKVVRVEPSLQAAFIEYGGGRHGFLAFSEIHPDYFRIPVSDREMLEAQAKQEALNREDAENAEPEKELATSEVTSDDQHAFLRVIDTDSEEETSEGDMLLAPHRHDTEDEDDEDETAAETARAKQSSRFFHKKYKIQEVIKSRQILLIQVVKEERGNKGAALTSYISLAGRYCVLMPNSLHGGGVSRKITDIKTRKRLKSLLEELDLPESMGVIVRTAGMERTKLEIKRDLDYLLKLWNDIRELTLVSTAPHLIYQEGDLIKRVLRDSYNKDILEILVEGDEAYKNAKEFMRLLMPSHVKRIKHFKEENQTLFRKFRVEEQIDDMLHPVVQLKSGGYIVINPTEALTAIDVNSGRSNKERHIDETALRTNLEAAEEAARQIRLRDLAGLVVIDFIDMSDGRHNVAVERRLREAMKMDRARIQLGRISMFGLLELSRQRLRPNILEANSIPCPHCRGSGHVRSMESLVLHILRRIEEEAAKFPAESDSRELQIHAAASVAFYLLNKRRKELLDIEQRFSVSLVINADETYVSPDFAITGSHLGEISENTPKPTSRSSEHGNRRSHQSQERENRHDQRKEPARASGTPRAGEEEESSPPKSKRSQRRRNRRHRRKEAHGSENLSADQVNDGTPEISQSTEGTPQPKSTPEQHSERRNSRHRNSQKSFRVMSPATEESSSVEVVPSSGNAETNNIRSHESAAAAPERRKRRSRYPLAQVRDRQRRSGSGDERPSQENSEASTSTPAPAITPNSSSGPKPAHSETRESARTQPEEEGASSGGRKKGWWKRLLDQ